MSDQSFHEIQLSGKQLFFLFMSAVVLAVVIFLFGVSVGRDVRGVASQTAQGVPAASDTPVPADPLPAQTKPNPNALSYATALQGREGADSAKIAPPTPPAEAPPTPAPPPASEAPKPAPVVAAPKADASSRKVAAKPAAAAAEGFSLQVTSVSTEAAATNLVNILKSRGYAASLVTLSENSPVRFRVHVGPYPTRAEALRVSSRLQKEGYKPFLIKR